MTFTELKVIIIENNNFIPKNHVLWVIYSNETKRRSSPQDIRTNDNLKTPTVPPEGVAEPEDLT